MCDLTFMCSSEAHAAGCPWSPENGAVQAMSTREWEFMLSSLTGPRTTLPGGGVILHG